MHPRISLSALSLIAVVILGGFSAIGQVSNGGGDMDLSTRPGTKGKPTTVHIYCVLTDIRDIVDVHQSVEASIGFFLSWNDPRLAHSGDGSIHRLLSTIWDPGIVVLNGNEMEVEDDRRVEVRPDGTVILEQFLRDSFFQTFDLRPFPFDRQELEIQFLSIGHVPDDLVIVPHPDWPSRVSPTFSVQDWKITGWRTETGIYRLAEDAPGRSTFKLIVEAERGRPYFIFKVILPMILIMGMSWLVYWIHPSKVDAQIGVGATSMLTLIAFRFTVDRLLPEISYLTRLDLFILFSMVLVFANLTESVATAHLYSTGRERIAIRIDAYGRWLYLVVLAAVIFFTLMI